MTRRRRIRIVEAPLAIASDGTVLVNVGHSDGPSDPRAIFDRAFAGGDSIFIGVAVRPKELAFIKRGIDNHGAELASRILGGRQRRREKTPR